MIVDINGIEYKKIENSYTCINPVRIALMMTLAFGGTSMFGKQKERPSVDIVEEYGLIELKKSKLSKNKRDWVVKQFHSNFKMIDK